MFNFSFELFYSYMFINFLMLLPRLMTLLYVTFERFILAVESEKSNIGVSSLSIWHLAIWQNLYFGQFY